MALRDPTREAIDDEALEEMIGHLRARCVALGVERDEALAEVERLKAGTRKDLQMLEEARQTIEDLRAETQRLMAGLELVTESSEPYDTAWRIMHGEGPKTLRGEEK
jgi:hypothetical protein